MEWLFPYLVLLPSLIFSFCTSQDNLVPGKSISANQTLISSNGTFALGFFRPENSTKYFLGIWYDKLPKLTVVWVANRESPLDSPGVFTLRTDGNLVVLLDVEASAPVWSTNLVLDAAKNGTTGLLTDTGNFVLRSGEETLWESFDHPSDTILPGMKISLNKLTGQQSCLTSWATLDDPRPGKFTLCIDPKGLQAYIWEDNSIQKWRIAMYIGRDSRSVFGNPGGSAFSLSYNFDVDKAYLTYSVSNSSLKMRVLLNPSGQIELLLWISKTWYQLWKAPADNCDFYDRCGPYGACRKNESLSSPCKCLTGFKAKFSNQWDMQDWSSGCVREKALTCSNAMEGYFSKLEGVKLPDHSVIFEDRSKDECNSECHQSCSCTAYAYVNATEGSNTGTCMQWFSDLIDLVENYDIITTHDIFIRVHDSKLGNKGLFHSSSKRSIVIAIVSAAAGLLIITFGCFLWKNLGKEGRIAGRMSEIIRNVGAGGGKNDTEIPLFGLGSILAATNNFSEANKLGEGGFGPVYKGILPENQEVAVKRLSKKSRQGHHEFMNELKLIAKLQHTNLVRLLGCCMEQEEMILIYEYMPNRSLDKFLFDSSEKTNLDWVTRFRIIEGVAQGVLYIHKYSRLKIIHRDLKASNVLLDAKMNPKVSDFGMARIF
ncbi:G-type lectin S-receptor-like serine/threonine-protein kinase RKS1 isoform X1 [Rosa chinensis]|uniref:G-type lectin S-receptor-like serine/threonine-protein kinase RKS1 isoform X1 n=1 Tax=Rosa chinensis TaxID=74649 RepID=UPI001AD8A735|nr:G-type lectin S-receptor-like serine/threonine-protein kinase RKS1 isoform X1 [Rosa chinensis]